MVSEWYLYDILNGNLDSLYRSMVLNGILNYRENTTESVLLKYH